MAYEWVSTLLSVVSLLVAVAAAWIAKSSLSQAKQVAVREQKDWKQRKWFDLYFKAKEIHDSLEHFQAQYVFGNSAYSQEQRNRDFNDLIFSIRKVHAMAAVFPRTQTVTDLFNETAVFKDPKEISSKERLAKIFKAIEGLRQNALLDTTVLD
jgi:hypothetical protein